MSLKKISTILFNLLILSFIPQPAAGNDYCINQSGCSQSPAIENPNAVVFSLPFFENWDSGQFGTNLWTANTNWKVAQLGGNHGFAALFSANNGSNTYESELRSGLMTYSDSGRMTPYTIWLDYETKLEDVSANSKENITVEIWTGTEWIVISKHTNAGDSDWTKEHIDITVHAKNQTFEIRFKASGDNSGDINNWAIDNINIYPEQQYNPAKNLVAKGPDTLTNSIDLQWEQPKNQGTLVTYILDDGTAEGGVYFNSPGEIWLGTEFTVADTGIIQSAEIFMEYYAPGNTYTLDVFNSERKLIGSSASFAPDFRDWTIVALPDIQYNESFYIMLHVLCGSASDVVVTDNNGPNAGFHQGWFSDGTNWNKLSDLGLTGGVLNIRTLCRSKNRVQQIQFGPGSASGGIVSPLGNLLKQVDLNISTSSITGSFSEFVVLDSYSIFRRTRLSDSDTLSPGSAGFELIAEVQNNITNYSDVFPTTSASVCYDYYVVAVYTDGEASPSDTSSVCIVQNMRENLLLSANPASENIRLLLSGKWETVQLFDNLGLLVSKHEAKALDEISISVQSFRNGAYYIVLRSAEGDTKTIKILICK